MSSARNKRLVVSALMLALALVLPYFTGGIPAIWTKEHLDSMQDRFWNKTR